MCIVVFVEIWFGIAHWQILTELSAHNIVMMGYYNFYVFIRICCKSKDFITVDNRNIQLTNIFFFSMKTDIVGTH